MLACIAPWSMWDAGKSGSRKVIHMFFIASCIEAMVQCKENYSKTPPCKVGFHEKFSSKKIAADVHSDINFVKSTFYYKSTLTHQMPCISCKPPVSFGGSGRTFFMK